MVNTCLACIKHRTLRASSTNWHKNTHSKQVSTSYGKTSVLEINFSFVSSFSNMLHLTESLPKLNNFKKAYIINLKMKNSQTCISPFSSGFAGFAASVAEFFRLSLLQRSSTSTTYKGSSSPELG